MPTWQAHGMHVGTECASIGVIGEKGPVDGDDNDTARTARVTTNSKPICRARHKLITRVNAERIVVQRSRPILRYEYVQPCSRPHTLAAGGSPATSPTDSPLAVFTRTSLAKPVTSRVAPPAQH